MRGWIGGVCAALVSTVACAQGVPPDIAAQLRVIGDVVNPPAVDKIYAPLHANAPKEGVKQTKDISYGKDERNKLDLYEPTARPATPAPVLIWVHGGGFARGNKSTPGSPFLDNVGWYFARNGAVVLNATYKLAPQNKYPSGPRDMAALVKWARANVAAHGGDPNKIYLLGHSAGAAHVSAYALDKRYQPKEGSGLAGAILVSGIYDPGLEKMGGDAFKTADPVPRNDAYFGTDEKKFASQAVLRNLTAPKIKLLIVYAELDPSMMQVEAGALYAALCRKHNECPSLLTLRDHDHISEADSINTGDELLSGPVLKFIRN